MISQIPPEVYKTADPKIIQQLIEEGLSTNKFLAIDDDFNNGLSRDWIKIPIMFSKLKKAQYAYYERKCQVAFD